MLLIKNNLEELGNEFNFFTNFAIQLGENLNFLIVNPNYKPKLINNKFFYQLLSQTNVDIKNASGERVNKQILFMMLFDIITGNSIHGIENYTREKIINLLFQGAGLTGQHQTQINVKND